MLRYFSSRHQKVLRLSLPAAFNSLLDMLQVITDTFVKAVWLWLTFDKGKRQKIKV